MAISSILLTLSLSIITRVNVSETVNESSEYLINEKPMSDNQYKPNAVETEEEWAENNIADSEAIENALDKMLANKKLIVKFKHRSHENDNIKVMHAVEDSMHNNETVTPVNDYKSMHVIYPHHIPNESPEEANQVNIVDKQDMKVKKIKSDHEDVTSESQDTPELIMVTQILKKKAFKKPILRNEHVLKKKNSRPHNDQLEKEHQSNEGSIDKHVSHKKMKRKHKKVPKKTETIDDEDSNHEKKLNEYYKSQLKERDIVKKAAPHRNANDDSLSIENDAFKKKEETKKKPKATTIKNKKYRKKPKTHKRVHKEKKKKKIVKKNVKKDILRNGGSDLSSDNLQQSEVLETVEIKIDNPIHGKIYSKRGKKHVVNDDKHKTKTDRHHNETTTTSKVTEIHSSTERTTYKYEIKNKDDEKVEFDEVKSNVRNESHESSMGLIWNMGKSIIWDNSEHIDQDDLTRTNHEKKVLNSYEELLKENDFENHPKLPFYISSIKPTKPTTHKKKHKKKITEDVSSTMQEKKTTKQEKMPFRQKKNYEIDMNATLQGLASSKILDQLTEKIATQMLQKLQKRLEENGLRALGVPDQDNDTVEQIEILFNNDGSMQVMNNKRNDVNGTMVFYDNHNAKRMRPAIY